jgi:tetratricopeptide (TPR) repeat protein
MAEMTFEQAFEHAHDLYQAGKLQESEATLMQILAVLPDQPETIQLAGIVMHSLGRGMAGIEMIKRAIDLQPTSAQFQSNLGVMLAGVGDTEGAIKALRKALELEPNLPDAHNNIGNLLKQTDRRDEAIAEYRTALELRPDYPEARNNLGASLEEKGDPEQALTHLRRALELRPDYPEALNNIGNAYQDLGRLDEAFEAYNRSMIVRPGNSETLVNRGNAYRAVQRFEEAVRDYRNALEQRPQYPEALWGIGFVRLIQGNFEEGWRTLEARFGLKGRELKWYVPEPMWDGSNPAGKLIVLHSEQGLGDTIQFVRYARMLSAAGAVVILLCEPELERLLKGQLGMQVVTSDGFSRPQATWQCPLMSLPRIFGTTLANVPARVPYINPDPALVGRWRERLLGIGAGLKVGVSWAGSAAHRNDRARSMPLAALRPLTEIPGVKLISLQKEKPARDAGTSIASMVDWTSELTDFADTAGLVANLDIVVSVDTSVAHLGGALGRRTCVMLPYGPDWRWLLNRSDSPWYPTMRLFRQPKPGDWETPVRQLAEQLTHLARTPGS